jgi:hypothetical protein
MRTRSRWLVLGACLSFAIALLHLGIIFAGPEAYTYFGAADLAPLEAAGSSVPDAITAGLVAVFAVFGCYALAGAGHVRRLPLLVFALLAISAVYTLRGLALFPELVQLSRGATAFPPRYAVFSLVSLLAGVAYLAGALSVRKELRRHG